MASGQQEYAVFPMAVMNITQGMNSGTHINSFAIDIAGRDRGIEPAFAPFTGVIKKIWPNGNSVWLESLSPVLLADGTTDYLTVLMTHDNSVLDLKVGQVVNQGVNYYQEGTAGNANGNHIHLNVGRGKFTGTGWHQNSSNYWVIDNEIPPYDAFYLSGTEIINGAGYPWKQLEGETAVQPTESQVIDIFEQFGQTKPQNREQINYYTGQDIRVLYKDALYGLVIPNGKEITEAFDKYLPDAKSDPNRIPYYSGRSSEVMYKDIAGVLKDKLDSGQNTDYVKVSDLYIKK